MKKKKHSKFRNTGLLYELLARQVTVEIMDGKPPVAAGLIKTFFHDTELAREMAIYRTLSRTTTDLIKAGVILESIRESHTGLDREKLVQEKYRLVRKINESYTPEDFFGVRVHNYKLYASVFHLLESYTDVRAVDPNTLASSKLVILESLTTQPVVETPSEEIVHYRSLDSRSRDFVLRTMINKFQEQYDHINPRAIRILMEQLKNGEKSPKLASVLSEELVGIHAEMKTLIETLTDESTRIKLNEVIKMMPDTIATVRPTDVNKVMGYIELLDELKTVQS